MEYSSKICFLICKRSALVRFTVEILSYEKWNTPWNFYHRSNAIVLTVESMRKDDKTQVAGPHTQVLYL